MIIGGTGHRNDKLPNKETGYILPNPTYNYVCQNIEKILLQNKPEKVISGMALGFDFWLANIAINLNIPLVAAIPFIGQEKMWPKHSQAQFNKLLDKASGVIIVSEGGYAAYKMQTRNEYIVNNCDKLIACLIPSEKSGGTFNCVKYAKSINKDIVFIDPAAINIGAA